MQRGLLGKEFHDVMFEGAWSGIALLWIQSWHLRLRGTMAMVLSAMTEVQM